MAQTFKSWEALEKAIQQEMKAAMEETEAKSYLDALHNATDYYSEGEGDLVMYKRTHQFENSPRTTDVMGHGNQLNFKIYLDQNYNYPNGKWSTPTIFNAIEEGFGGKYAPKGKHGRWQRTLDDIEDNINESFGKRFHKA